MSSVLRKRRGCDSSRRILGNNLSERNPGSIYDMQGLNVLKAARALPWPLRVSLQAWPIIRGTSAGSPEACAPLQASRRNPAAGTTRLAASPLVRASPAPILPVFAAHFNAPSSSGLARLSTSYPRLLTPEARVSRMSSGGEAEGSPQFPRCRGFGSLVKMAGGVRP